jgi:poly-gamma-glutamate capsule biosynthesis protein CapA/YwtB (metallophosphatase superfamily)
MGRRRVTGWMVVALAVLTACAANPVAQPAATTVTATTSTTTTLPGDSTTSTSTSTTVTDTTRAPLQPVTIAFGGDIHFEGALRSLLDDPANALAPIAPVLSAADLAIVNLETAVTDGGSAVGKQFVFRAPPSTFDALAAAGVDAASLANNHGVDFGMDGLLDSLTIAEGSGVRVIGAGRSEAEAFAPWIAEVRGSRIAIIGATQVLDEALADAWSATGDEPGLADADDIDRLLAEVSAARVEADTVVVFIHWGVERETCPSELQRVTADRLIGAGADVIVGSHAHRLAGAGRKAGAFVAYGLGNFVWYRESGASGETGVLEVTVTGRTIDAYRWIPARIRGGVPTPLEGDAANAALDSWNALRDCTDLAA